MTPQVFYSSTLSLGWTKVMCSHDIDMPYVFITLAAILSKKPLTYGITTQPLDLSLSVLRFFFLFQVFISLFTTKSFNFSITSTDTHMS